MVDIEKEFEYLRQLEKIEQYQVERDGKVYKSRVFMNGDLVREGECYNNFLPLDQAIQRTKVTIDNIIGAFPKVFLRIYPEIIYKENGYAAIYTRLAF